VLHGVKTSREVYEFVTTRVMYIHAQSSLRLEEGLVRERLRFFFTHRPKELEVR
jgi:hypothetical protein